VGEFERKKEKHSMSNKRIAMMMATMGLMSSMSFGSNQTSGSNDGSLGHGIPDNPKRVIPNGCKEYEFYGFKVVALSEKRARAKALKLLNKGT